MITILRIDLATLRAPGAAIAEPYCTVRDAITGWIIATDMHDARRQAHMALPHTDLAQRLYLADIEPPPGKYWLGPHFLMLVA